MVLGEKKYLNVAHACSELIWKKGILHKGAGLCHGLSGKNMKSFLNLNLVFLFRKWLCIFDDVSFNK